jgi:pSer/pThr/pTyr-binding forkhead associated (FHA) protein
MRVILEVTSGPSVGRHIPLQEGEIARFGRSDMADVCFPDDVKMSGVHFELECQGDRCLVRDLQSASGTLLNEQPVSEANLRSGDIIKAGQTSLLTSIKGAPVINDADQSTENKSQPKKEASSANPRTLPELCAFLEMEEDSLLLLQPEHTPETFVETLDEHERFADAIRVLSFCLPKPRAVWWAYRCVQDLWGDSFSEKENAALDAALRWVKEPTDDNRRLAAAAAEIAEYQSAPSWVALAAFWSEGSLAPPELPVVAPDERLTSQGVSAALLMTATRGDVTKYQEKFQSIVRTGRDLLSSHAEPGHT